MYAMGMAASQTASASRISECLLLYKKLRGEIRDGFGGPETWQSDGTHGTTKYDTDFSELYAETGQSSFTDLLKDRKQLAQTTHILDLFGSGFFVENPELADSITGMRWGPIDRTSTDAHTQLLLNQLPATPNEILGDAMNPKTWEKLKVSMRDRKIPKIDLVTMRPHGGWLDNAFDPLMNATAIEIMVENVLSILSDNGRFYFSVDTLMYQGNFSQIEPLLNLQERIESTTPYRLILKPQMTDDGAKTRILNGLLMPKPSSEPS